MTPQTRVFVAEHEGFLGAAFCERLAREGYSRVLTRPPGGLDLADRRAVGEYFDEVRPEVVILSAGTSAGIVHNRDFPGDMLEANLALVTGVLAATRAVPGARLLFLGSSCMYPRECPQPMAEDALLTGRPEATSLAYAMAKLAGVHACLAYNQQEGTQRFLPVIPGTIYGPGDDFDPESSHVIPGLIRRLHEAEASGQATLDLWGTGAPKREFLHVDDLVDACLHLLGLGHEVPLPINIGSGEEVSIAELAGSIASVVGYRGELAWDRSRPDGAPRKLLDSSRLGALGWTAGTTLAEGLRTTYTWFLEEAEKVAA